METESDVVESLLAIGYDGHCTQNNILEEALAGGPKSNNYRELVEWLTYELHILAKTDEKVEANSDEQSFLLELSGMLKELGCPYKQFVDGPLSGRFQTRASRILLLDYLICELMTAKMCRKMQPEKNSLVIPKFETNSARALVTLTKELNLGKPPDNVAPKAMFDKILFKLEEVIRKTDPKRLSEPLLKLDKPLTEEQWTKLEEVQKELDQEYNLRRDMMITRMEVTIQSFQWGDEAKKREDEVVKQYQEKKNEMEQLRYGGEDTDVVALLAARQDLAVIEKMSNSNVRKNTATSLQKHVIGMVPDRGGRANEHAPPPPEMPSWQKERTAGRGGGGGGRGGGGRGGGQGHGGGNWRQHGDGLQQQPQYMDQRRSSNSLGQRQQFDNRQQYSNQGSGRVQGGWSQRGNDQPRNYQNDNDQHQNRRNSRDADGSYQGGQGGHHRGGGGGHYRGGGRGGGSGGSGGRGNYQRR